MEVQPIYDAENRIFANEPILTEIGVKRFFCHIIGDPWFIDKYGTGYKIYTIGPNFFDASYGAYKEIYLLDNMHFTESAVCHELGHACKRIRSNPHGRAWQKRYVELIGRFISLEKAEELESAFKAIQQSNQSKG